MLLKNLFVICLLGYFLFSPVSAKITANSLPEIKGWVFEDQVFSDSSINNIDVVELDDGRFRAYYMNGSGIFSAISDDGGKTFVLEEGARISGGQHHAVAQLDNGQVRLYYSTPEDKNLHSAISDDGLNFTEEDGIRLALGVEGESDSAAIIHPSIVKLEDDTYKLYYDALNGTGTFPYDVQGIMSASSGDGLNFTKDSGLRIPSNNKKPINFANLVWSPFIEFEDGLFKLYFSVESNATAKQGAYIAVSEDGVNFQIRKKPILKRDKRLKPNKSGPGGLPGLPQDVFIINVEEGKRLFYWSAGEHGTYSAFNALVQ
jgi:predicted GH43/DUF377 family glycosyl hydrolase